jgi:hypothetical protein
MEITNDAVKKLTPKQKIEFALFCAEKFFHFNNDKTRKSAQNCIDLVKKYLKDPDSVTIQELTSAYNNLFKIEYEISKSLNLDIAKSAVSRLANKYWSYFTTFRYNCPKKAVESARIAAFTAYATAIYLCEDDDDLVCFDCCIGGVLTSLKDLTN